jgi:predicted secreted Zn-dependent protease
MTEEMFRRLLQLAQLLLDARLAASAVKNQAEAEWQAIAHPEDYDVTGDLGALRERVAQLMARGEERENR